MRMKTTLTREQSHSLWLQGERVVSVVFEQIPTRVGAHEKQYAKNSGNSFKPTGTDGYKTELLQPIVEQGLRL